MADDNTLRSYRSNDNQRRSANSAEAQEPTFGSDPLAELARLIGQNDPFADSTRRQPHVAAPRIQDRHDDPSDWRRHIQRPAFDAPDDRPFDADARYGANAGFTTDARYNADARYDADGPYQATDLDAGPYDPDPYRMSLSPEQGLYVDQGAQADHWDQSRSYQESGHDPSYAAAAGYAEQPIYAVPPQHGGYAGGQPPHADEAYDDPPRRKRGSSLVTAVILIGCAMLGTAGAYGYRTYSASPGTKQAPVIIADSAPSKIVPANEQKSVRSQDRVASQSNDERLVSREEQPVALPSTSAVPRVVFPSPVQTTPPPATTGSTPSASQAMLDQPKRIRTVPIRPEGGDTSGQPTNAETSPRGARTAPQPQSRTASREQPMSLDPNASAPANERPQPQQRPLTPPAPRETAAPASGARLASAPSSGGFVVQVSSQKSEADAQASYRSLQAKYSQLKSHQPIIRRADLGSKGVFYRAMVGPFESGDEAVQFCNDLKQAGGQCIIHRN